jgi:hypothetical protein
MKNTILITSIFLMAFAINSCNDDSDCDNSSTGGIINVNINGLSCDSVSLDESFSADKFSSLSPYQDAYITDFNGQRLFHIERSAERVGSSKYIIIEFSESGNILTASSVFIYYSKLLDDNSTLVLQLGSYPSDTEISNFSYDATTGTLKGDFVANYDCFNGDIFTSTIIVSGDFDIHVTELLNKK